jgi:hypothetical protein
MTGLPEGADAVGTVLFGKEHPPSPAEIPGAAKPLAFCAIHSRASPEQHIWGQSLRESGHKRTRSRVRPGPGRVTGFCTCRCLDWVL